VSPVPKATSTAGSAATSVRRKIALVTGAGSGIGRVVALALAKTGYTVVLAGRRLAQLEAVAGEGGAECVPVRADVSREASVDALFHRIAEAFGRLDLLFNNAGTATPAIPLDELPLELWRGVIETNLTGTFLCTRAAVRLMKEQSPRGGRIINNGSISATVPRPRMVAYTASKHAITGLTKATALEGRPYEIACGQIDIGNAGTPLAAPMAQGTLQPDLSLKPEPIFDVKHVADAVLYMAGLPLEANVLFMTVMATKMPYVGRG
jgi:NAD(P)-dependent dehydrogenase (short-subunit alcohol dehydrogenase family)